MSTGILELIVKNLTKLHCIDSLPCFRKEFRSISTYNTDYKNWKQFIRFVSHGCENSFKTKPCFSRKDLINRIRHVTFELSRRIRQAHYDSNKKGNNFDEFDLDIENPDVYYNDSQNFYKDMKKWIDKVKVNKSSIKYILRFVDEIVWEDFIADYTKNLKSTPPTFNTDIPQSFKNILLPLSRIPNNGNGPTIIFMDDIKTNHITTKISDRIHSQSYIYNDILQIIKDECKDEIFHIPVNNFTSLLARSHYQVDKFNEPLFKFLKSGFTDESCLGDIGQYWTRSDISVLFKGVGDNVIETKITNARDSAIALLICIVLIIFVFGFFFAVIPQFT